MEFRALLKELTGWSGDEAWVIQVFVVVFIALLLNLVLRVLLSRLHRRLERTSTPWDDAMVDAVRKPLTWLVWIVGIAFAAEIAGRQTEAPIFEAVDPLRDVGVIGMLAWFLWRLVGGVQHNLLAHRQARGEEVDYTTMDAVAKLLRASIVITAALVALQTLGFSISGVLAFGGIGGIAVGFAAKDLLANFFGGLMVYLDRPFAVGDWVRSPDRELEGVVEEIGWRLTRIRAFDKRPIYVPNATFTSIAVQNPSRMTHRRIYETIGVRYADVGVLPAIIKDVEEMLRGHPDLDTEQTTIVNFDAFGASSLDFMVYCFTRTVRWAEYHAVKQDVLFRIADIIAAHGAEIAFPTRTLHVPDPMSLHMLEAGGGGPG